MTPSSFLRPARWLLAVAVLALDVSGAMGQAQHDDNPHGPKIGACSACHRADAWKPVAISKDFHHAPAVFPLEGSHQKAPCTACHRTLDFANTATACAACHTDVHHGEFGTQCSRCHTTRNFVDPAAMRRMHDVTRFPLRGAHAIAACEDCHVPTAPGQAQYANRPTTCFGCHATDYQQAKVPDHVAGAYPQVCTQCHGVSNWQGATFDHSRTAFALTGAHRATACAACHGDGVFKGKPTVCVACHQANFDKTSDPPHAASGFPTACETCHSTSNWTSATFNHNSTNFPLTGAHMATACTACHGDGVFKGKPTACVSCHQTDFNQTTDPGHAAAGFATTCQTCHSTTNWTTATFDHTTTAFPLTGVHKTATCASCHGDGVYKGKPTTCVSCHQTDYNNTTDPVHSAAGFSTTCAQCHTTSTWSGATFDHDNSFFPIYSGSHQGRWSQCSDCHTSASNFSVFTCMSGGCHGKSGTDSNHRGVSGYVYDAVHCYSCHPRGRSG
jgi:hypothetical protein